MDKRFWIGASLLGAIALGIASTAPAQSRLERIQQLRQRA